MFVPTRLNRTRKRAASSFARRCGTSTRCRVLVALLAPSTLGACNLSVPEFDSVSGGATGGGSGGVSVTLSASADDTGSAESYSPDPNACVAPCSIPADCCKGTRPSITTGLEADDAGCPSDDYPNNWTCVSGHCRHGGCSTTADCIVPGLECMVVDLVGFCVFPCDETTPCPDVNGNGTPDTVCTGEADNLATFCEPPAS
jgi:hypothetical protein